MFALLSGIFGGLLRLMPEVFKAWNLKQEMKHELDMQKVAYDFQVLKGNQRMDEISAQGKADWDKGGLDALKTAIDAQARPSGVKWIDGLSSFMRPLITLQWVVILYPAVLIATFCILVWQVAPPEVLDAIQKVFGAEEKAIVSFIIDFWFVGRVLDAGRKRNA